MNRSILPLFSLLLLLFLSSCITQKQSNTRSFSPAFNSSTGIEAAPAADKSLHQPKMIRNAHMELLVKKTDSIQPKVVEITNAANGYVMELSTEGAVLNIPDEQLESAMEKLATLGKVKLQFIRAQDVSEVYADNAIRLENAEITRKRYLELLNKAHSVKDALLVEAELERLNEYIDRLKGSQQRMDHQEKFAKVKVLWKVPKKPGILGYVGMGLYYSVKWLFVRN